MCAMSNEIMLQVLPVFVFYTAFSPACVSISISFFIIGFCGCNSPFVSLALCEDVILLSSVKLCCAFALQI